MALQLSASSTGHTWRAQPNHTPQKNTARWLLAGVILLSGLIAGVCAVLGAWPVLPFAGMEIFVLWLALRYQAQHALDGEEITLDADNLCVVVHHGDQTTTHSFHPYWAQIRFNPASAGHPAARLVIHSHGREVEIGRLLNAGEKQALAQTLKQQIHQQRYPFPENQTKTE